MFDWQDLHFFLATARLGSSTAAATELGVDHATVGRRVAHLETSIERKLVVRLPRSTRLTKDGQALVGVAHAMNAQADTIVRQLQGHPSRAPVTVRVSALPVLAAFLIAPSLRAFAQDHPETHMALSATSAIASLERAEADIAIGFVRPELLGRIVRQVGELTLALMPAMTTSSNRRNAVCSSLLNLRSVTSPSSAGWTYSRLIALSPFDLTM